MGALVAALFAMGRTPDQIIEVLRSELVHRNPFRDFTVPRVALLRGGRLTAMLARLFGDTRIEDLPIDCFCVSADLFTADLVVHRLGDVRTALAATMTIPGVTPPISAGGRLLVDGGVLDNLPVGPMAVLDAGPIVAVDVMRQLAVTRRDGEAPLTLMDILVRSTVLGSRHASALATEQVALVISPPVQDIGLRDFRQIDRAVEAGRRAARTAFERDDLASTLLP